jgi:integrase/recombinase XerC
MVTHAAAWTLQRDRFLTFEEVKRVLDAAMERDSETYLFLAIAANTGLRLSEVLHLKVEDYQAGKLRVTRRKKRPLHTEWIDVSENVESLLEVVKAGTPAGWIFPGDNKPCILKRNSGEVERLCDGGHRSKRFFQHWWVKLLRELGLTVYGRGIHQLRHAAITEFYTVTKDLRAAQAFAGHSSVEMTSRYAHVVDMKGKLALMRPMV